MSFESCKTIRWRYAFDFWFLHGALLLHHHLEERSRAFGSTTALRTISQAF